MALWRTECPSCFNCSQRHCSMGDYSFFPVPLVFLSGEIKQRLLYTGMLIFRARIVTVMMLLKKIFNLL